MIRVSVVSYLNSKPFVAGLTQNNIINKIDLSLDIPSTCAEKLINGKADIGLIPIAVLPLVKNVQIITPFCIASNGNVNSVLLLSQTPLNEIKQIWLDYQSRTSVMLAQLLAKEFWKIDVSWLPSENGFENKIEGQTAGVVIGDRALALKSNFKYVYDLATEWKKHTGLPFVFACWVSNKSLPEDFINAFSDALNQGVALIPELSKQLQPDYLFDVKSYLTENIDFRLDKEKEKALKLFLGRIEY